MSDVRRRLMTLKSDLGETRLADIPAHGDLREGDVVLGLGRFWLTTSHITLRRGPSRNSYASRPALGLGRRCVCRAREPKHLRAKQTETLPFDFHEQIKGMAETQGFEPWVPLTGYDDLANRCLKPLGHVSSRRRD